MDFSKWKFWGKSIPKSDIPVGIEAENTDDDKPLTEEGHHMEMQATDKYTQSDPKESTRSRIAQIYVWAFFAVIAIVFLIGWDKPFSVDEYKDMLVTVSGILSGPLGFIVGYYFKASSE